VLFRGSVPSASWFVLSFQWIRAADPKLPCSARPSSPPASPLSFSSTFLHLSATKPAMLASVSPSVCVDYSVAVTRLSLLRLPWVSPLSWSNSVSCEKPAGQIGRTRPATGGVNLLTRRFYFGDRPESLSLCQRHTTAQNRNCPRTSEYTNQRSMSRNKPPLITWRLCVRKPPAWNPRKFRLAEPLRLDSIWTVKIQTE